MQEWTPAKGLANTDDIVGTLPRLIGSDPGRSRVPSRDDVRVKHSDLERLGGQESMSHSSLVKR